MASDSLFFPPFHEDTINPHPWPSHHRLAHWGRSPLRYLVLADVQRPAGVVPSDLILFEMAGPRAKLFFDPARTRAGIVTCGGLCPGLNDVIRSLFLELQHGYGVKEVLGFRGGYQGLDPARGKPPVDSPASGRTYPQGRRHGAGHFARAGGLSGRGGPPDQPA